MAVVGREHKSSHSCFVLHTSFLRGKIRYRTKVPVVCCDHEGSSLPRVGKTLEVNIVPRLSRHANCPLNARVTTSLHDIDQIVETVAHAFTAWQPEEVQNHLGIFSVLGRTSAENLSTLVASPSVPFKSVIEGGVPIRVL